ncbi:MAG: HEAT repeat domain-containing protein [Planctomycetota bacterium]
MLSTTGTPTRTPVAVHAVGLVAMMLAALGCAVGCSGRQRTAEGESRFAERLQREKSVDDITPEYIAELDSMIAAYRVLSNNPAEMRKAHAARTRVVSRVKPYLPAMEFVLMHGGSHERRRTSAIGLGFVDNSTLAVEAVRLLVNRVLAPDRNERPHTRYCALIGLAELGRLEFTREYAGGKPAPDPLPKNWNPYPTRDDLLLAMATYITDEYPEVRAAAAEALGRGLRQGEHPELLDDMIQRLAAEPEPDIRLLLVEALAYIGDPRGLQQIEAQALVDPDPWVREDAVIALGRSGRPEYVEPLVAMLEDPDPSVRTQTVEMLRESCQRRMSQGGPVSANGVSNDQLIAAISEKLRDNDAHVRERAILALGHIGDESVVMDLVSKLGDSRRDVRKAAIYSLGLLRAKADRAVLQLIKMLSNREEDIRSVSRLALVGITGQDLGDDATDWQKWYDAGRPGVRTVRPRDPGPAPQDVNGGGGGTTMPEKAPEGAGNGGNGDGGGTPPEDSGRPGSGTGSGSEAVTGSEN